VARGGTRKSEFYLMNQVKLSFIMEQKQPNVPTCRICLEEDDSSELIMPCRCSGTQSWVHRACLDHWRAMGQRQFFQCGTCLFNYEYEERAVGFCKRRRIKFIAYIIFDITVIISFTISLGISWAALIFITGFGAVLGELINSNVWAGTMLGTGVAIIWSYILIIFMAGCRDFIPSIRRRYNKHKLYANIDNFIVRNLGPSRSLEPRHVYIEMQS
jgi:RING-variant domain